MRAGTAVLASSTTKRGNRCVPSGVIAGLAALGLMMPALGQNAERGRQLYEMHCGGCHYERLHQRDRARSSVRTLADLYVQVSRWASQTNRQFTLDELDDVVEYLDRTHYRIQK